MDFKMLPEPPLEGLLLTAVGAGISASVEKFVVDKFTDPASTAEEIASKADMIMLILSVGGVYMLQKQVEKGEEGYPFLQWLLLGIGTPVLGEKIHTYLPEPSA